ncbi:DUF4139 domain-containing protein [Embleya scabrispora]|uniref:DUF4139 domain-containing protein n=1 Tax=Embleya scabrispora TaxID=159449 RepID=UPI0003A7C1B3|nr:DUF4139 domain-containing protein [Embleya scabrispora]MYS83270.1 DUF4139 domain-containing protein [Streptomyces sp. SID5474]
MLTVASELRSVVVHAVGAVCVRNCEVELPAGPPGPVRVRVSGFPLTAYGDWLRARVVAGGTGVRVTDVRPVVDVEVVRDADLPSVLLDLEAAESRVRTLHERGARLAAELEEIAGLTAIMPTVRRGDPPRTAPVSALLDLAAFADERAEALYERIGACDDELREAIRDTELYRARLNAASGAQRTERAQVSGTVVITLEHTGDAGPIGLDVEYHVPGARWAPMYQLRLDEAMTGGTLVMRACVAQRTGEDWTGVRLGLSTADLARGTDLPELKSLRLGRRQSVPAHPGWREPPAGLAELFAGYDVGVAKRPPSRPAYAGAGPGASGFAEQRAGASSVPPPSYGAIEIEPDVPAFLQASPAPVTASAPPMQAAGGFGAPPPAPRPAAPMMRRSRSAAAAPAAPGGAMELAGYGAPADEDAIAPSAKPAPPEQPEPGADLLDYAALELRGAHDTEARGRLRPAPHGPGGTATEYRRRADEVSRLVLPEHALAPRDAAGSYDYRFDTAAPAEVSADGVWHTIPVCEIEVGLDPEFVCVPALDEAVFGTVVLANASPHALLAGPADVSVAGEFLMTVPLPTLAPGARERVGVGVVESVQVSRNAHMRESTAGLRGGTAVLDHRIEIEAVNHLARPIRLDILERIPVTDDKDVKIEEHAGAPRWVEDTELRDGRHVAGARVWHVELAPGERRNLTGGYEIRIPAAKAVVGGNRRV